MAQLDEGDRYAAAALFTLALHSTEVDVGVDDFGAEIKERTSAWGCPSQSLYHELALMSDDDTKPWPGFDASKDLPPTLQGIGFWGFDACAPGGACRGVYRALHILPRAWPGLLNVPDSATPACNSSIAPGSAQRDLQPLIWGFVTLIDPAAVHDIDGAEAVAAATATKQASATAGAPAGLMTRVNKLAQDMRDVAVEAVGIEKPNHRRQAYVPPAEDPVSTEQVGPPDGTDNGPDPSTHDLTVNTQAGNTSNRGVSSNTGSRAARVTTQPERPQRSPAAKSVAVIHELISACLAASNAATVARRAAEAGKSAATTAANDGNDRPVHRELEELALTPADCNTRLSAGPRQPFVHWYDARCRVALKCVASWLAVPLCEVHAAERACAAQLLQLDHTANPKLQMPDKGGWRNWKIGAGAVGGAALLAVTGGLAAPALAAGLGSVLGFVGLPAAGAVGAFGASTAGTAAIAGGFGYVGAEHFKKRTAEFVGDVKEFGFWNLSQSIYVDEKPNELTDQQRRAEVSAMAASTDPDGPPPTSSVPADSELMMPAFDGGMIMPVSDAAAAAICQDPAATDSAVRSRVSTNIAEAAEADSAGRGAHVALGGASVAGGAGGSPASTDAGPSAGPDGGGPRARALAIPQVLPGWLWAGQDLGRPRELKRLLAVPVSDADPSGAKRPKLALTIAVNGWVSGPPEDFVAPWADLPGQDCDRFALVWESDILKSLGVALSVLVRDRAIAEGVKAVKKALFAGIMAALALPMTILGAVDFTIGNKWLLSLNRAEAAGCMLARLLAGGYHGGRPVTLVGFSMGARLIFYCLLELHRMGCRGIVEDVILLGAPVSVQPLRHWAEARSVVAGRFVNAYSTNDWVLGVMYRVYNKVETAGGLVAIDVPGVTNIDQSALIGGHNEYVEKMPAVLRSVGLGHDQDGQ